METLSRHFLRRRARTRELAEQQKHIDVGIDPRVVRRLIRVEKAQRGPFRWRVVKS